ncbi:hypothetical protein E2C01_095894 [Portunus trituberculatus]|uniref:Uncharacterized protein n=1 Tax=Portunus trituberculatus TaxID=210409 RepID=A0A5B7JWJ1_PORTR|nr:hypothetical protein [Portunus trituberculatus]
MLSCIIARPLLSIPSDNTEAFCTYSQDFRYPIHMFALVKSFLVLILGDCLSIRDTASLIHVTTTSPAFLSHFPDDNPIIPEK